MPLRSNSATVSRGAGGSLGAAADCGTRSIEGDAPRRDEFDLHVRGIYASLLESLPQQVCPGQRRRTLHVNDDHAAAGGDVARGPADLITERTRCRQRLGFACGVAADGDGCRSQGTLTAIINAAMASTAGRRLKVRPSDPVVGATRRWKP